MNREIFAWVNRFRDKFFLLSCNTGNCSCNITERRIKYRHIAKRIGNHKIFDGNRKFARVEGPDKTVGCQAVRDGTGKKKCIKI
jgi:hypothetical protein